MNFAEQLQIKMDRWNDERAGALGAIDDYDWSLARGIVMRWFQRNNTPIPATDELLLVEVHKMRARATSIDRDMARRSAEWLRDRGVDL